MVKIDPLFMEIRPNEVYDMVTRTWHTDQVNFVYILGVIH